MSNLPEGLHLVLDREDGTMVIQDAQDVVWVTLPNAHHVKNDRDDPVTWFTAVVRGACDGLGVTGGVDVDTGEATVERLIVLAWLSAG